MGNAGMRASRRRHRFSSTESDGTLAVPDSPRQIRNETTLHEVVTSRSSVAGSQVADENLITYISAVSRQEFSARGDSLRNFCDRSSHRARPADSHALPVSMHDMHVYVHARVRTYTCRDDELDRVIVPLATGSVVGTIKACVPGVKTCKDALYKVPARHPAALPRPSK